MKKTLSIVLSLVMVLSALTAMPFSAFAKTVIDVTSAAELSSALNGDSVVDEINITADITVNDDCTIKYDAAHINNYSNTVVTIDEGVTVVVADGGLIGSMWPSYEGNWETPPLPDGRFINNGTVIVENGGAIEADFDTNNGDVIVRDGGEAVTANTNNGNVTVEDGGVYATSQGKNALNNGTVIIHDGATMESRFGSSIVNNTDGKIKLDGEFLCTCLHFDNDVMLFENHGEVTGNGSVILREGNHELMPVNMDAMIEAMMAQLGQEKRFENWDDISIFKQIEVSSFEQLASELTGNRVVAGENVAGDMDTIVDIKGNIEIPKDKAIETMAKLIVHEGGTVIVNDCATLECGVENNGKIDVCSGAKLCTTMGGNINNHGSIAVSEGAELKSQMGGAVFNYDNASLILDGVFYCGCIGLEGHNICWFENSGNVSGKGKIILYQAGNMPVSDTNALVQSVTQKIAGDEVPEVSFHTEHSWSEWTQTKAPTETEKGEEKGFCSVCGEEVTREIAALGHSWGAGKVTKAATPTATGVMTYTCTVCGATRTESIPKCAKYANPLTAKGKTVTVKLKNLKKKNQTVTQKNAFTVSKAQGKVTYVKANGNSKITVAKNGKLTVKKGLKKGTYKIKIKVTAAGNASYKAGIKTVIVTIKVK